MTGKPWYDKARHVNVGDGCGAMKGGQPRAVHHTTEGGSIDGAVATYRNTHAYPTFTIDYAKDDVVQHLPVTTGATAVENASGGVDTNREGTVCIQIEWVGQAEHPFTTSPEGKLRPAGPKVRGFFDFLRSHGIPDTWPMGPPKAYPASYGASNGDRDPTVWHATAGHYGHSQVPENHHGDPGAIDPTFVKQTARPAATPHAQPAPAPAPAPAAKPTPKPAPTPTHDQEDDIMQIIVSVPDSPEGFFLCPAGVPSRTHIATPADLVKFRGMPGTVEETISQAQLDAIPLAK